MPSSSSSSSTHPSTTASSRDDDEWLEASDWDNPHQVARLYHDWTLNLCGHALQWDPIHLVDAKQCPVCQRPIHYIVQGTIEVPTTTVASTTTTPTPTTNAIKFQFGKKIFWISQQPSPSNHPTNKIIDDKYINSNNNNNNSWIKRVVGQWKSSATHASSTNNNDSRNTNNTAQDCIQSALGLTNGFKILHRGKVLYPPPSSTKSSSKTKTTRQKDDDVHDDDTTIISQRILQLSQQPGETVVVMGTLRGRELVESPSTARSSSLGWWRWSQRWVQLPSTIVYHGTISVWLFIKSFLAPFLPSFLMGEEHRRMHHD